MITTRLAWGGPALPFGAKMSKPATSVTAHHPYPHTSPIGASVAQEIKEVRAIHAFHAAKWLGVGYNFLISQNGNVYECRGWGRVGAHAGTSLGNETSYGIAFLLNGYKEGPSSAALTAFRALRAEGVRLNFLTVDHLLKFHRDWKATDCPGNVCYNALLDAERAYEPPARTLMLGMRGPDVKELQRLLGMPEYQRTAFFGRLTALAVRNFQHDNGLEVDGMVGERTWAKLRA